MICQIYGVQGFPPPPMYPVESNLSLSQAAADFNFIECTAENTVVFQVRGDGYIEIAELVLTAG